VATLDTAVAGRWRPSVVLVAASTGGPTAVARLLGAIPAGFCVPLVLVQHMPEAFTGQFAARLDPSCALDVREAGQREALAPGACVVAAGGHHLRFVGPNTVERDESAPRHGCRPAADVLLESAVEVYGARCLSVVLTGMGRDGCAGSELVRTAGGKVFAQDRDSSAVWGMPGAVVGAGLADVVGDPESLARALVGACR